MAKPETWPKGKIYLSCVSLAKSTTNKDLLLIGDDDENYMAKIYTFTIIRYTMEGMGITPAEEHIEKYKRADQFCYKIFVPFLAFGQLTTGNKRAQVIPLKQGIENNEDLDFLQPKSTNEIIVFDLKNSSNLNAYLKTISTDLSPILTPRQKAFNVMNLFHIIGCKIGHSYARNAVILKGPDIRWIDATGFDKFSSLAELAKNPDEILVTNFKKLLDVNRLLIDNSYIEHLAGTSDYDSIFYQIYKFTQENVQELKNVIFFSKRFVSLEDAALADDQREVYSSQTALMSRNDQIRAHLKVIYDTDEVKSRNDVRNVLSLILRTLPLV